MVARVTLAEVDTVRFPLRDAIALYEESVLPELREQDGYQGVYVLATPEGKALVLTLWDDAAAAEKGVVNGYYEQQVRKFVTTFRAPPGRDTYDVVVMDGAAVSA